MPLIPEIVVFLQPLTYHNMYKQPGQEEFLFLYTIHWSSRVVSDSLLLSAVSAW